jgi:hypothetical protein
MTGRRRATIFALLALLGALALLAAGCGGGDSDSAADETTIETTAETTTETEDSTEETTSGETTGDTDLSAFASEDCLELAGIGAKFGESLSGTGNLEDVEGFFQQLADKAPDEIKDDLLVLAGAMAEYAEAFKDVDMSSAAAGDPETIKKLQELAGKFDDAKYTQASQNIQSWAEENCGATG